MKRSGEELTIAFSPKWMKADKGEGLARRSSR